MSRCPSCGCEDCTPLDCTCAMGDSTCITFTGSGSAANPFVAAPVIDPDPANLLSCGPDGLLAQVPDETRCPPAVRVRRTTNQTIGDSFQTAVSFDAENFDHGGMWAVGDPTKLVIPEDGLYMIGGTIAWDLDTVGLRNLVLTVNATTAIDADGDSAAQAGVSVNRVSTVYDLNAGDFVQLLATQTSGGDLDILSDAHASPVFWAYRIRQGDCP